MTWIVPLAALLAATVCLAEHPAPLPVGTYWSGSLLNGMSAQMSFRARNALIESLSPPEFQYATHELIEALVGASRWLRETSRGKHRLQVGDLSKRGGGKLALHVTHQMGLDADIAYLPKRKAPAGHRIGRFHNRFGELFVRNRKLSANFDLPANYALLKHFTSRSSVSHIYVGCEIKRALLAYRPEGDDPAARERLLCPVGTEGSCVNDEHYEDYGCVPRLSDNQHAR
jgi:murein endopeptidase